VEGRPTKRKSKFKKGAMETLIFEGMNMILKTSLIIVEVLISQKLQGTMSQLSGTI
jgi:hypothetical protein